MSDSPSLGFDLLGDLRKRVPNEFPKLQNPSKRLAIIGEAPGEEEVSQERPFVGASGRLLDYVLSRVGVARDFCFVGNVCQVRPPSNNIAQFDWSGAEIQEGLAALREDIVEFNPNLVLLLGATALKAAGISEKITTFRGTLFECNDSSSPFYSRKCLATYHPAAVLRMWEWKPILEFDVLRASNECESPKLNLPYRSLYVNEPADFYINVLNSLPSGRPISFDIEGTIEHIPCISFAPNPSTSYTIPFHNFSEDDQMRVWQALHKVLTNPDIPKILQNCLYDMFVLAWNNHTFVRGVKWDTMLSGWEIYPELPKGLGFQSSLWTKEPAYKQDRKSENYHTLCEYCAKDSAVTFEIAQRHHQYLTSNPEAHQHFQFNMSLIPATLYMELRGNLYDKDKAALRLNQIESQISQEQTTLNTLCGRPINVNSPKKLAEFLYDIKGFPAQRRRNPDGTKGSYTTDVDALLTLLQKFDSPILHGILAIRKLEKLATFLRQTTDSDGRVRCGYSIVGTETGRFNCYESPTGSGGNRQTIPETLRDLYIADPTYAYFQCDLSGADGWTVAAHCAKLGDATMLNDYQHGLKPAKIVAAMFIRGPHINRMSREELAEVCNEIPKASWQYFACKRIQHATNYGVSPKTVVTQLMSDSYKKDGRAVYVSLADCTNIQNLYLLRYPGVALWQRWVARQIVNLGYLECASGHVRRFMSRRMTGGTLDHVTYKAALAHEPQANTTYATNLALHKLWHDPQNYSGPNIIIQPLHQVHDALCGQFPIAQTSWAIERIRSYFSNEITIANMTITIPFEGGYGPSWRDLPNKI